jgi:ABC-2 type transport system permease protein
VNLRRIFTLLGKEFIHGPKGFILIMVIVVPVGFTLIANLAFGSLFSEKPDLGIYDQGGSQLVAQAQELGSINTKLYDSRDDLIQATSEGAVDIGLVLPQGFDDAIVQDETVSVEGFVWGESLAKSRTIIPVAFADLVRELAGQEVPVEIQSVSLGDDPGVPWNERLLPMLMFFAVFFSGVMLPSTSLIDEKQKRTLQALVITPASVGEIFTAKALMGIFLSVFLGVAVLFMNGAFGANWLLLVLVLFFSAVMAVEVGLIAGVLIKDITTLFTVWKSSGILLAAPVFIYLFPQIPEWVGQIFPTYYTLQPVVALSLQNGGWSDIAVNFFVLLAIDAVLMAIIALLIRRSQRIQG